MVEKVKFWKTEKFEISLLRRIKGDYRLSYKNSADEWLGEVWSAVSITRAIQAVEQSKALKKKILTKLKTPIGKQLLLFT